MGAFGGFGGFWRVFRRVFESFKEVFREFLSYFWKVVGCNKKIFCWVGWMLGRLEWLLGGSDVC